MTAKDAFEKSITHCRWLGIPISWSGNKSGKDSTQCFFVLNSPAKLWASTSQLCNWEDNFKGAFKISLYFKKDEQVTWEMVAALLHEIGHVTDFRENMFLLNRKMGDDERAANQQALKIANVIDVPKNKIENYLRKFITNYKLAMNQFRKDIKKAAKVAHGA